MDKTQKLHKTQIENQEASLLSAIKNADTDKLEELLHDDLLFNLPNGITITKTMDLETYQSGNMVVSFIETSDQIINLIDDTAVVSVKINLKGKFSDQVIDGTYKYIRVWKLSGKNYKVIAGSCIAI